MNYLRRRVLVRPWGVCAALLVWLAGSWALGQSTPPGFRSYSLRHARAEEAATRLRETLSGIGAKPQVLVDPQSNQLFVSGSDEVQRLTVQLLQTLDQPPAAPARPEPATATEVRGYRAETDNLEGLAQQLQAQFPPTTGTRIVVDDRTRQLIIMATPEVHRAIAARLPNDHSAPLRPTAPPPATAADSDPSYQLQYLNEREFEQELQRLWGGRLTVTAIGDGLRARVAVPSAEGPIPVMDLDRRHQRLTFLGDTDSKSTWRRFVQALDSPYDPNGAVTQVVSLQNADPHQVKTAVSLLPVAQGRTSNGQAAAAIPFAQIPGRKRYGGDLVSMIFQAAGQAEAAPQPAAAQPPAAARQPVPPAGAPAAPGAQPAAPGEQPAVDEAGGGLMGPVSIEILEGLDIIVIKGNKRDVERVKKIIEDIERFADQTRPIIEVYPLKHVNSEAIATLVTALYTEILQPRQGQVSIRALVEPNALLLIGREESVAVVKGLIDKLDQPTPESGRFEVFHLKYLSAVDAETTIRNFFTARPGFGTDVRTGLGTRLQLVADFRTNSLIVQASPRDMEEVRRLVESLDVEQAGTAVEVRVFYLKNALATDLATVLQSAITGQAAAGTAGQQQQGGGGQQQGATSSSQTRLPAPQLELRTIDQDGAKIVQGGILTDASITADAATNALIVRAPKKSMELIAALIEQLDRLPDASSQIKVFTIINGDAQALAATLQQLFGQTTTTGLQGGLAGLTTGGALATALQTATAGGSATIVPLRFVVDQRTNSIITIGSEADLTVVGDILLRLDEDADNRKVTVIRLRNTQAAAVANAINTYLTTQQQRVQQQLLTQGVISPYGQVDREVFIVSEDVTNSVIVSATPRFYDTIVKVIQELDQRQPMVMVQVLIAEVTLNNTLEFGAEFGLQDSLVFDRGKAVPQTNPNAPANPGFNFGSYTTPNQNSFGQETLAGQALTGFGVARSSGTLGYGGLVLSAANESVNILLRALQDDGRLQVLSRPEVMTQHNQPAFVQVGEDVARITGSTINNLGNTQNNVQDVPTGIILSILPLINDDGMVLLGIEAQRSSLGPEADGTVVAVNSNGDPIRSPRILRTIASTTISARDGQTVVFAGLITKENEMTLRRVPYLSDVPLLGNLFKFERNFQRRKELLIIMTPRVVRGDEAVEWMKQEEASRMSWCLSDLLAVTGDLGLPADHCAFCTKQSPLLFPDCDPTGAGFAQASAPESPETRHQILPVSNRHRGPAGQNPTPGMEGNATEVAPAETSAAEASARLHSPPAAAAPVLLPASGSYGPAPTTRDVAPANFQPANVQRLPAAN